MFRGIGEKIGRVITGSPLRDQYSEAFSAYDKREQVDRQINIAYDRVKDGATGERRLLRSSDSGLSGQAQDERLQALHRKLNDYDDRFIKQLKENRGRMNFASDLGWLQREALRQFMRSGGEAKVLDIEALRMAINDDLGRMPPEKEFEAAVDVLRQYVTKGAANGKVLK